MCALAVVTGWHNRSVRTRELLRKIDRTLDRMDEHMTRGNELMQEIRREHQRNRAAIENNTRVMRELLLQRQEDRVFLERIEQGIHAQTQGLLHVLDELRNGRGGPGTAPAA
jgi:hypothetical protein